MKFNAGTIAFLVAFALAFAITGVGIALAVPYDPGLPDSAPLSN